MHKYVTDPLVYSVSSFKNASHIAMNTNTSRTTDDELIFQTTFYSNFMLER